MIDKLFYCGYDTVLIKADKDDPTIIFLEASNEMPDSDEEMVLQKALEDQAKDYLRKGVLSWDHQHKLQKDPKFIVGEPVDVAFSKAQKMSTMIKGRLYEKNDYAQSIIKMLQSGTTRLGASIGGAVVTKSEAYNENIKKAIPVIQKIKWDEVAITHKPVNQETLGQVTYTKFREFGKSFMFTEEMNKALMAGGGVDASTFTGGRTLIPESIGRYVKDSNFWKGLLLAVKNRKIVNYDQLRSYANKQGLWPEYGVEIVASVLADNKIKILEKI